MPVNISLYWLLQLQVWVMRPKKESRGICDVILSSYIFVANLASSPPQFRAFFLFALWHATRISEPRVSLHL